MLRQPCAGLVNLSYVAFSVQCFVSKCRLGCISHCPLRIVAATRPRIMLCNRLLGSKLAKLAPKYQSISSHARNPSAGEWMSGVLRLLTPLQILLGHDTVPGG
jgi:hypothetical protein